MATIKIDFQSLLNQSNRYSISTQLDVFQWMLATGWEYQDAHYDGSKSGVFEWVYGLSSRGSQYYSRDYGIDTYRGLHDFLRLAFLRAIVDSSCPPSVKQWRQAERISLGRYRMLSILNGARAGYKEITDLFRYSEKTLTTQLNEYHPKAIEIRKVLLSPDDKGWVAILHYGYDHSTWYHDLTSRKPFGEAVFDATKAIENLTHQSVETQVT